MTRRQLYTLLIGGFLVAAAVIIWLGPKAGKEAPVKNSVAAPSANAPNQNMR